MSERILTSRDPAFVEYGEQIFKQHIEWREPDGKVVRRGHRMVHEDGRLHKPPPKLKYEAQCA